VQQIYLSRRNLLTLLNKLNRKIAGGETACSIIKKDNTHKLYPQTMAVIQVTALEDTDYYVDRIAGEVHPLDDPST
jgi:hypothetical protein